MHKKNNIVKTKDEVIYMEDLRGKIRDEIEKLEEMIKANEDKEKIEKQRKKLDEILEKYLKDL